MVLVTGGTVDQVDERARDEGPALVRAWRDATRPHPQVTDRDDRRRVRMVCYVALSLALLLSVAAVVSLCTSIAFPDPDKSLGFVGTGIVALAAVAFWVSWYWSKQPAFERGAWATVITIDAFLIGLAPFFTEVSASLALGFAVPVLCATIFLGTRGTVWMFFLSMALCVLLLLVTSPKVVEMAFVLGIMIAVVGLSVLVAVLREEDLKSVRRLREFERADAERLRGELDLARRVQLAMLPDVLPVVSGLDIAAFSEPAFEASGDFYDVFPLDHGAGGGSAIGVVVCDVAGKGVASALVMSATRTALRAEAERNASPASVLTKVNATIAASIPQGLFVTIFYGVYDAGERVLRFASAGHPHPFRWKASEARIEELASYGMPLGLLPDSEYEDAEAVLDEGDFVVIYTDGLVEALNKDREMFGFDNVEEQLLGDGPRKATAYERLETCLAAMRAFIGDERLHDDVTLVALARDEVVDLGDAGTPERESWAITN